MHPVDVRSTGDHLLRRRSLVRRRACRRTHQGYRVAGRTPAKALYDLLAEQWLLPPMSAPEQEVPLAS
jgi:hypothetical protein